MHHRGHALQHVKPAVFDIYSDAVLTRIPCSSISPLAHGACVHYVDEFDAIQASKCFGLPNKVAPAIDGAWSSWEDEMRCSAPCSLAMLGQRNTIDPLSVDYINGQSVWSFRRRTCSNPNRLGKGAPCHPEKVTSNKRVEFNVKSDSCANPWQLAHSNSEENCECGCHRFGHEGGVIFSPAPWKCRKDKLVWTFECKDCSYLILDVLHHSIAPDEAVYITEQKAKNETFKIDSKGVTQHDTQRATIIYDRNDLGCGFALKISFNKPLVIPRNDSKSEFLAPDESVAANFGVWGILLCSGFLLLLIIASIFNCRNGEKESEKHNPTTLPRQDFEQYTDVNNINSPTKVRPNAACFSLAQQQLRLMKQEGRNEGKDIIIIIIIRNSTNYFKLWQIIRESCSNQSNKQRSRFRSYLAT